jgi:hypothetical protein
MEKVAAALYCADLVLLLWFQILSRDYLSVAHPVSDYGLGRTARAFKAYVVLGSIAAPLLAWQFWVARGPSYPWIIPVYLLLVMVGRLGIGLYPNDPRGAVRTRSGHIHHAATLLAAICAYMTVAEATPLLAASVSGALAQMLSGLKHVISLSFIAVMLTISPPLRRFFGLAERVFLYAAAVWCLAASLSLPPV